MRHLILLGWVIPAGLLLRAGKPVLVVPSFTGITGASYGALIPTGVSGDMTVTPSGVLDPLNGVVINTGGPAAGAASFKLTGAANDAWTLTFPNASFTGPTGSRMTVDLTTLTQASGYTVASVNPLTLTGVFDATRTSTLITVGLTLKFTKMPAVAGDLFSGYLKAKVQDTTKGKSFSTPVPIQVKLDPAIAITATAPLDFGSVAPGTAQGTVVIHPDGTARSASAGSGIALIPAANGQPASFTVTGNKNHTYAVALPSSITLTQSGGTGTLAVDTFTSLPSGSGCVLDATGTQVLTVGASLTVNAGQTPGTYSGTFNVTVAYN